MKIHWIGLFLTCLQPGFAATSTAWQINGFSDFSRGKLTGLKLTADGFLQPGPGLAYSSGLGQPAGWAVAADSDGGGLFVATGHSGKVLHVDSAGHLETIWSAPQPEVFALCTGAGNSLYAGTSPNGGVYKLAGGKAAELWHSPAKYIWAIVAAPDGSIYVGTGDQGRIYRIQKDGTASVYFESGQANVTALAVGNDGVLYAGTDPNGLIYRIAGPASATVLYDSSLPEIRSLVLGGAGELYAAAMGGAVSTRTGGTPASFSTTGTTPTVTAAPTVLTVTEASEGQGVATGLASAQSSAASTSTTTGSTSAVNEVSGVDKSAVYRISTNGSVETLRTSKEDNVYDLAWQGSSLLVATDNKGRIYQLEGHRLTLMTELGDGTVTRLLRMGSRTIALESNPGRVVMLEPGAGTGCYESPVHDATSAARWGQLQWHGSGAGIGFETRSGYAIRPDSTWSPWAAVEPRSKRILSPPARFIQVRANWQKGSSVSLDDIDVPYLARNGAPAIRSISVVPVAASTAAKPTSSAASSASAPYSVTVTDTGEAPAASSSTSGSQTVARQQSTQMQISWQADDPDGDKLAYSLHFRAEESADWQPIRTRIFENSILLDTDVFADGRYLFRVVATDAPSNAKEFAQTAEFVSTPVLIDNTPPEISLHPAVRSDSSLDVDFQAQDKTSALRLCEFSVDAGPWQPLEAQDGVTDSPEEVFHLHLEGLAPGQHLLVVRVYDAANNVGLAKLILR